MAIPAKRIRNRGKGSQAEICLFFLLLALLSMLCFFSSYDVVPFSFPNTLMRLYILIRPYPMAQLVKNMPAMQKMRVQYLGWKDPLEKEMATHSRILVWRIPRIEEPGGLQSMGSQKSQTQFSD